MKIAIVHDWMTGMRGGEKVLLGLAELFPQADLFTLVHRPERMHPAFRSRRVTPSFLQRVPFGRERYQYFLPFYHWLMGGLDLSAYDLILSSSSACAKWVRPPKGVLHLCYCHTPMRYLWDLFDEYFGPRSPFLLRWAAKALRPYLKACDLGSNDGVSHFIANSTEVQGRIRRTYGRESVVIHPPVDLDRFTVRKGKGEHYLVVSALVPYKRVDLAVSACTRRDLPLVVVGRGSEEARLRRLAGPKVSFKGWVGDDELPGYYAAAKALLFPGKEDFGIVPIEALASGLPVVAFGEGGVLDSLEEGVTGTFFHEPNVEALLEAMRRLEGMEFDPGVLRGKAAVFSKDRFLLRMREHIQAIVGTSLPQDKRA